MGGRGGLRAAGFFPRRAEWLIGLQLLQLELVLPVFDTTAVMPRSPRFAISAFVGLAKMKSHLGKQCHFGLCRSLVNEYVKAKCM